MAIIKPFRAIRPTPELARYTASPPYDVINSEEARAMATGNPYSFLYVEKAEINFAPTIALDDPRIYEKARTNLHRMIAEQHLIQDTGNCLYIYRAVMAGRIQTGLVGCTAIDDYITGVIKIHEQTRPEKVLDRMRYIEFCQAHTGLIFLACRPQQAIMRVMEAWIEVNTPVYDFVADDGIQHSIWVIDHNETIRKLIQLFEAVETLYVADGHHRSASAAEFCFKQRERHPEYSGDEAFNYFLSVIFPSDQVTILDYNRVIKDLHGFSEEAFLARVREQFELEPAPGGCPYQPTIRHTFGMYLAGTWYKLTVKPGTYHAADPIAALDVSILQNNLLAPVLGIHDPRTDQRIDFVGGMRGLPELERRVAAGMAVAFALYPTHIEEVMAIADAGQLMPPKSTWFEPKVRSGLFVHAL